MTDSEKQIIVVENGTLEIVSDSITHEFPDGEQVVEDTSTTWLRVKLPKGVSPSEFNLGDFYRGHPFNAPGLFQVANYGQNEILLVKVEDQPQTNW